MIEYEFWKDWKRKTKLEEAAIKSIKSTKRIILKEIPKEEIIAICVKGSFVRREMNKKSDVDTVTILKTREYLPKLKKLEEKYRDEFEPKLQIVGYSLWELKTGKRTKFKGENKASSSRFVKHLNEYRIIYGKTLQSEQFFTRSDKEDLQGMVGAFRKLFLPALERKEFSFSEVAKQVFWLVENEQKLKGKNPPHHWRKLAKSIKDKNHIIHDALRVRLKPTKDKKERAKFIRKLNKYLLELDELIK